MTTKNLTSILFGIATLLIGMAPAVADDDDGIAYGRTMRLLTFLSRPAVRKELELTNHQIEELIKVEGDRKLVASTALFDLNDHPYEERVRMVQEFRNEMGKFELRAIEVLLPRQKARLNQLLLQDSVRATNTIGGLTHPRISEALELKEPQLQDIRAKAAEADAKLKSRLEALAAEIAKAKEEARNEVFRALTDEQRKKYDETIGKLFDVERRE